MNKSVRDIIEAYVPKKVKEEVEEKGIVDIETLFEDDENDIDDETTDQIINDITELYNDADEETQNMLDEMIETEEGLEQIVTALYEEDDEDEDDEDEDEDDEDQENIQELKTSTLVSYIGKAVNDVAATSAATREYANRSRASKENHQFMKSRHENETADKLFNKSWKRRQAVQKAVKKIAGRT